MIYNVTLCRQLIFEGAIEAESEEEAVETAMERNGYDDLNWRRNGPTQVICVEPEYDQLTPGSRCCTIHRNGWTMRKVSSGRWTSTVVLPRQAVQAFDLKFSSCSD